MLLWLYYILELFCLLYYIIILYYIILQKSNYIHITLCLWELYHLVDLKCPEATMLSQKQTTETKINRFEIVRLGCLHRQTQKLYFTLKLYTEFMAYSTVPILSECRRQ